jgi:hypothetical protein
MTVVSDQLSVVGDNTGAKLMREKFFVWLLATVLLSIAPLDEAQQPTKFPLGFLIANSRATM